MSISTSAAFSNAAHDPEPLTERRIERMLVELAKVQHLRIHSHEWRWKVRYIIPPAESSCVFVFIDAEGSRRTINPKYFGALRTALWEMVNT